MKANISFSAIKPNSHYPELIQSITDGIIHLFRGNYREAYKNLRVFVEYPFGFISVQESRLLMGRAMILAKEELDTAEFYFNDIAKFSITQKHLAEISVAYFLAQEKDFKGANQGRRLINPQGTLFQ